MLTSQNFHSLSLNHIDLPNDRQWLEPTSPTLSTMSWLADKSDSEIVALLKNANATLREKEYDLNLTTEIKQYLLQDNMKLHSQYESLLKQVEENEQSSINNDNDDLYEQEQEEQHYLNKKKSFHEQQNIKIVIDDLEDKNMELEQLLESAQKQSNKLQNLHSKKTRELQNDIQLLSNHLNLASQHIEELEEQQQYRKKHHQQRQYRNDSNNNDDEIEKNDHEQHETLLKELQLHITKLENENNHLIFTKRNIQEKLSNALYQINHLKQQFHECEGTQQNYHQLQLAYQQQIDHINELHLSLEKHRDLLSTINEENMFHDLYPSSYFMDFNNDDPSIIITDDSFSTNFNNNSLKQNHHHHQQQYNQLCTTTTSGKDLRSELENAWRKDSENNNNTKQQQQISQQEEKEKNWRNDHYNNNNTSSSLLAPPSLSSSSSSSKSSSKSSPSVIINPYTNKKYQFTDLSCFYYSDDQESLLTCHQKQEEQLNYNSNENENENHDLFSPIDNHRHHLVASYNLYPNLTTMNSLVVKQQQQNNNNNKLVVTHNSSLPPMKLVHKVQRWCRFAIVLTMAIAINIAQGPETMLEQEEQQEEDEQ